MSEIRDELDPPFEILEPAQWRGPVLFNSPHSGCIYPRDFRATTRLDLVTLRRSEDSCVDELAMGVVKSGFPLMRAHFPRAFLDLNREPYELDPRMFDGRLPSFANTRSMRVAGGLGTIPRIVADGQEIYRGRLSVDDGLRRIELLYKPYHRALRQLVHRTARTFGHALLIDCHSMPSTSVSREDGVKADFVLGDRYGTSCTAMLTDLVDITLRRRGYSVVRNKPYAGGFITEHYGEPALGRHALQIEINRALYMDERSLAKKPRFETLRRDLEEVFSAVTQEIGGDLTPRRVAAE